MAKKKGGKKKKDRVQIEQTQLGSETPAQEPMAESPAPEVIQDNEPALTDAVSEVIGDDQDSGRKEKKSAKKFRTQVAKFAADGYDVSALEAMAETSSPDELKDALRNFEEGIERSKAIKESIASMDFTGFEKEAEELNALLSNPLKHAEASAMLDTIKFNRRSAEITSALNKMVLPAMKPKVETMKAMLQNSRDMDAIENEFSNLKREYKEAYAEEGVKAQIVTAQVEEPAKPESKPRTPMVVKDIFLLYKDGKFISHHTNRVISKEQQKELFADLKIGRDFLRNPKFLPQKLNIIPGPTKNILVQSGRFTVVIVVAEGTIDRRSENITTKVITLMEKEDQLQLKDWKGDVSVLKNSGKYMQALLFAFMKLSKGTQ